MEKDALIVESPYGDGYRMYDDGTVETDEARPVMIKTAHVLQDLYDLTEREIMIFSDFDPTMRMSEVRQFLPEDMSIEATRHLESKLRG